MAGLASLFDPAPTRWGLRGDPSLWSALRADLAGQPLPNTEGVLLAMLETAFRQITGQDWSGNAPIPVPALAGDRGGLSNGLVSPDFWRESAVPLLVARWRTAAAC